MAYDEISRDINLDYFIDLCGGNIFEALEKARELGTITICVSYVGLERRLIHKFLELGYTGGAIAEMLGVNKKRVQRIKRKLNDVNKKATADN